MDLETQQQIEAQTLQPYVEPFKELATRKVSAEIWEQIYLFLGGLPAHLIGRLCLRLFARICELENRIVRLEDAAKKFGIVQRAA